MSPSLPHEARVWFSELSNTTDGVVTSEDVKEGTFFEAGKVVVEIAEQAGFRW